MKFETNKTKEKEILHIRVNLAQLEKLQKAINKLCSTTNPKDGTVAIAAFDDSGDEIWIEKV